MASSIATLYLLVQNYQHELQHELFSHLTLMALASVSRDANYIVHSTIAFKQCTTYLFCHVMPFMLVSLSISPLHLLAQDDQNEVEHDFLFI